MVMKGVWLRSSESNSKSEGVPIVLTSPPNEISDYNLDPFMVFLSSFPNNIFLRKLVKRKFLNPKNNEDRKRWWKQALIILILSLSP